ncbi:hypothetical protein ACHAXN_008534 [Cyclotella atomus]
MRTRFARSFVLARCRCRCCCCSITVNSQPRPSFSVQNSHHLPNMRLSISATSFAAAVAASQALLRLGSNSAVASAVDVAYEKHDERLQAAGEHPSLDEECDFVTSFKLRGSDADAGILGCTNPEYVCVEDDSSSRGGRCVPDVFAHRKLQTSNTPPCTTKCTGIGACGGGTDPNIVGAASCCGYRACFGITGTSSIDAGSCLGNKACYKMKNAVIGAKSCRGDSKYKGEDGAYGYACAYLQGTVGYNSCIEYGACYQKSTMNKIFHIGDNSCYGASTCSYAANTDGTIKIGDESCNGYYACYDALGSIGSGSCNAKNACYKTYQYIGNNLCNTENECFENKVVLTSEPSKSLCISFQPRPLSLHPLLAAQPSFQLRLLSLHHLPRLPLSSSDECSHCAY